MRGANGCSNKTTHSAWLPRRGYLSVVGGIDGVGAPGSMSLDDVESEDMVLIQRPCGTCKATGKVDGQACPKCLGSGKRVATMLMSELVTKVREQLGK